MRKTGDKTNILRAFALCGAKMLTAHRHTSYPLPMEQIQPGTERRSAVGGAMSRAATAKDRVDSALSRLESMVDERLRVERERSDELAARLAKVEGEHEELKRVAMEVEARLERAMEYIRSLLAADQS
jgi:fumarylacetoacetate (FAA) hydrolase family protein